MNPGDWVGRRILCIGGQFLSGWRLSEGNIGARLRQIEIDQERDHLLVDRGQRWGRGQCLSEINGWRGLLCPNPAPSCLGCISWRSKKEVYYCKMSLF